MSSLLDIRKQHNHHHNRRKNPLFYYHHRCYSSYGFLQYNTATTREMMLSLMMVMMIMCATMRMIPFQRMDSNAFIIITYVPHPFRHFDSQQQRHYYQCRLQKNQRTTDRTTTNTNTPWLSSSSSSSSQGMQRRQPLFAKSASSGSNSSRKNNSNTNQNKKGFGTSSSSKSTGSTSASIVSSPTASKTTVSTQQEQPLVTAAVPVVSKKERDVMLQRLQKQYGGTTPAEIAMGTQRKMTEYIQQLPLHIQMAIPLYTKLQQYNTTISKLSIYQQTTMFDQPQMDQIRNDLQQLQDIYETYHLSNIDLHNILQQMTWDTSAYAKMVKSQLGRMNINIAQRIQKACSYIVDAVVVATTSSSGGRCLDVGCGYGTLIPILTTSTTTTTTNTKTIQASQIYGMDISTEMIKCGQDLYPNCHFIQGDFLQYDPTNIVQQDCDKNTDGYFDGIIFCSSLHDMPNIYLVLEKAISLLRNYNNSSTIVIVHAQGAGHVQMQHIKNPILVPQLLPTAIELQTFIDDYNHHHHHPTKNDIDSTDTVATTLRLTVAPANANTPQDIADGYLAVIQKVRASGVK